MISTTRRPVAIALSILVAAIAVWACGGGDGDGDADASGGSATGSALPQGSEPVNIDPAEFTTDIDNPYWPMKPGSRWVYREVHSEDLTVEKVVVTVTSETKKIANGVTARVVRDVVSENGVPTEVTDDWYAQDSAGNVWYMGEATTEYVDGKPKTTAGSFEAGVDGAQPGIIMPADPKPGLTYREEYYEGEAEDAARIVSLGEQAEPPAGHFPNALMTRNINPLEPKVLEFKFYAKGVGPVSTVGVSGGSKLEELVSYSLG
jgi:hypothetical protein